MNETTITAKYPKIVTYIVLGIIAILLITCTVQKDRKAVNRVKSNIVLLDQVFVEGLKLHPCANESTVSIIRDTLITTKTDTIKTSTTDTIKIRTTRYITYTDTIKSTIIDGQMIKILTDTVNVQKRAISFQAGQMIEKDKQIISKEKSNAKLWLYITVLIVLLITSNGLWIYLKFKPI